MCASACILLSHLSLLRWRSDGDYTLYSAPFLFSPSFIFVSFTIYIYILVYVCLIQHTRPYTLRGKESLAASSELQSLRAPYLFLHNFFFFRSFFISHWRDSKRVINSRRDFMILLGSFMEQKKKKDSFVRNFFFFFFMCSLLFIYLFSFSYFYLNVFFFLLLIYTSFYPTPISLYMYIYIYSTLGKCVVRPHRNHFTWWWQYHYMRFLIVYTRYIYIYIPARHHHLLFATAHLHDVLHTTSRSIYVHSIYK